MERKKGNNKNEPTNTGILLHGHASSTILTKLALHGLEKKRYFLHGNVSDRKDDLT